MAQKVQVLLTDDIDGSEAEETVQFALDGVSYEIDLSAKNAEKLRRAVSPFADSARRVSARRQGSPGRRSHSNDASEIREWARANGYEVSDRGRISEDLRAEWAARKR